MYTFLANWGFHDLESDVSKRFSAWAAPLQVPVVSVWKPSSCDRLLHRDTRAALHAAGEESSDSF